MDSGKIVLRNWPGWVEAEAVRVVFLDDRSTRTWFVRSGCAVGSESRKAVVSQFEGKRAGEKRIGVVRMRRDAGLVPRVGGIYTP